jgi:hypothetical protein
MPNSKIAEAGRATQFKAGNPGGPGRPKKSPLTDALRRILDDERNANALAMALFRKAMKGSYQEFKEIADRVEGKAAQRETESDGGHIKTILIDLSKRPRRDLQNIPKFEPPLLPAKRRLSVETDFHADE